MLKRVCCEECVRFSKLTWLPQHPALEQVQQPKALAGKREVHARARTPVAQAFGDALPQVPHLPRLGGVLGHRAVCRCGGQKG